MLTSIPKYWCFQVLIEIKVLEYLHLTVLHFFYKHIKIWGLGSDIFKVTQDCLYVLTMSCTHFRANPHSIVAWMSRNSLLETGAKSEVLSDCNGNRYVICSYYVSRLFFKDFAKYFLLIFIIFWKVRNSYFQGPPFSGCLRQQFC